MNLRTLWSRWLSLRRRLDRLAWPLGAIGLMAVAVFNWRQWQRDKELLARVKEPPPLPPLHEWPELPLVSVLVAAWNEADFIERHIKSFLALRYPHKELVLCAGGLDGTFARAKLWEGPLITIIEQQIGDGKQKALRRSLEESTGDLIYLTDADCLLEDDPFLRTIFPLVSVGESVVTGEHRPLDGQLTFPLAVSQWFINLYVAAHTPRYVNGLKGANSALRRTSLMAVGAFDDHISTGTDYHLAQKLLAARNRILYEPSSTTQTVYPVTFESYRRKHSRWIRNGIVHGYRHGDSGTFWSSLWTAGVGAFMTFWPLFYPVSGNLLLLPWMLLIWHTMLARLRYGYFGKERAGKKVDRHLCLALLGSVLIDYVTWASVLFDLLVPTRRGNW